MLTDEKIDEIGFALECGGMSHSEINQYFEHAGIKGMRWGIRRELKRKKVAGTITKSESDALRQDTKRKVGLAKVAVAGILVSGATLLAIKKSKSAKSGKQIADRMFDSKYVNSKKFSRETERAKDYASKGDWGKPGSQDFAEIMRLLR